MSSSKLRLILYPSDQYYSPLHKYSTIANIYLKRLRVSHALLSSWSFAWLKSISVTPNFLWNSFLYNNVVTWSGRNTFFIKFINHIGLRKIRWLNDGRKSKYNACPIRSKYKRAERNSSIDRLTPDSTNNCLLFITREAVESDLLLEWQNCSNWIQLSGKSRAKLGQRRSSLAIRMISFRKSCIPSRDPILETGIIFIVGLLLSLTIVSS